MKDKLTVFYKENFKFCLTSVYEVGIALAVMIGFGNILAVILLLVFAEAYTWAIINNKKSQALADTSGNIQTLVCPKCGSTDVNVQVINEIQLTQKHKGVLWWIFIGSWWVIFKWAFFTLPALIVKIFSPKKYKTKNVQKSMAVCQHCGKTWRVG